MGPLPLLFTVEGVQQPLLGYPENLLRPWGHPVTCLRPVKRFRPFLDQARFPSCPPIGLRLEMTCLLTPWFHVVLSVQLCSGRGLGYHQRQLLGQPLAQLVPWLFPQLFFKQV